MNKRRRIGVAILVLVAAIGAQAWRMASAAPIDEAAKNAAGEFAVAVHMRGIDSSTFVLDATGETVSPIDWVWIRS